MQIQQIIEKKKQRLELSDEEILYFVNEYTAGSIPDYQAAAWLMAVCLCGMTHRETATLTNAIAYSGETVDLSSLGDTTVDKHSTGGVGDKTTLIVAPIAAAVGARVAKMTGRGLGHTGGTADKLESIPGFRTDMSREDFLTQVEKIGIAVVAQNAVLAPADKKLYALRDVTATVNSVPLIASSIIGKKLASGARSIVLDVKYGSGSFMKTREAALVLAETMVDIGARCGRNMSALITDMDRPLGRCIGNALEVREALEVLSGEGCPRLTELCLALATEMVTHSLGIDEKAAKKLTREALYQKKALAKFGEWIGSQGANADVKDLPELLPKAKLSRSLYAPRDGFITHTDAERIGYAALLLGAGRRVKEDRIDHSAGIVLERSVGDAVKAGDTVATLYSSDEKRLDDAMEELAEAIFYGKEPPMESELIFKIVRRAAE